MRRGEMTIERSRNEHPDTYYARVLLKIAETAPLRLLPCERIVGSATLLEAVHHMTPLCNIPSTSHTTIGFHRVLGTGYSGLRRQISERLARRDFAPEEAPAREAALRAMLSCLDAADVWRQRYVDLLGKLARESQGSEHDNYVAVLDTLRRVPEQPPRSFREAVQSLWFMYAFHRLAGNWSGIGRIDEMLGPYLQRDLERGVITLDEAREHLAHFWIKGTEWIGAEGGQGGGSGDAQFYQNIILGGVDASGREVTNDVTYLVLDVVEELHISDFPIAVRLNRHSPQRLLRRMAEVQRHGGGIVAAYNEEVVVEALAGFGYPLEEARTFTNDGCWEVLIPGRTSFTYIPFDALALLHEVLGLTAPEGPAPDYASFDALFDAYSSRMARQLDHHQAQADQLFMSDMPSPLLSLFVEDCIERAQGYHNRGARYVVVAPHAGGLPNVSDSLHVIKQLVYEQKYLSLPEFVAVLRDDWRGHEQLAELIRRRFRFYGNDDDEADSMMQRVFNDYGQHAARVKERAGVLRPAGISTFGREIGWADGGDKASRRASPDGHRVGAVLATNFSPSPGSDRKGPTAVLRSCCSVDFRRTPNCAAVELKIHPVGLEGERGRDALVSLMRGFVRLGGMFLHIDVVDSAMLLDAQRHPDKYPNLSVRIAGWSARFATLNRQWQDMIIQRTQQSIG